MTQVSDPGLGSSVAIPYEAMGTNVRNAISAVETNEDDPGVMKDSYNNLFRRDFSGKRTLSASIYIARSLCYPTTKPLNQNLVELRTALQLERSYSRKQLFTIFANRVYFGPNLIGVHDASASYFGKEPSSLSIEEGALLITLLYSPTMYSPVKHPDRALQRRNQIIDTMAENGSTTAAEAQTAKAAPLGVITTARSNSAQ